MALSLGLHGTAVLLLFAVGAAGGMGANEPALLVELALSPPSTDDAHDDDAAREAAVELPPPEEPPPVDASALAKAVEIAPSPEPPPVDMSELKPAQPPKPAPPPKPQQAAPARRPAATAAQNAGSGRDAQQASAGFLPAPPIVWEGKPRFRHPPAPAAYPQRAVELDQQGEVVVRVRLDPEGNAVEIVLHRPSGFTLLDKAALAAVRGWHFLPAVRDGRPVAAWVEIPVRFHLR